MSSRWATVRARLPSGVALVAVLALSLIGCNSIAGLEDLTFEGTGAAAGSGGTGGVAGGVPEGGCGFSPEPEPVVVCPDQCSDCPDGKTCVISCPIAGACTAPQAGDCPPGMDCIVQCTSLASCSFLTVRCPDSYACVVECSGQNACSGASVQCSQTGVCEVVCSSLADSCESLDLYCGQNACSVQCHGVSVPRNVVCHEACACETCS